MKNTGEKGFTLIELLIVIGIIATLASILVSALNPFTQFQRANDAKRKSDLSQIQKALEQYYNDNNKYPDYDAGTYQMKPGASVVSWGGSWSPYLTTLPKDPSPSKQYVYFVDRTDFQTYWLYANLDRGVTDPQACNGGNACPNAISHSVDSACGMNGTKCNYGLSSTNTTP